jgi:hypothetical protein
MSAKSHVFLETPSLPCWWQLRRMLGLANSCLFQAQCTQLAAAVPFAARIRLTSAKVRMASHSTTLQHQDMPHRFLHISASPAAMRCPAVTDPNTQMPSHKSCTC